jgi:hypothetical protein
MTRPSRFAIGLWTVVLELTTKWYKPHAAANRTLPKAAWLQLLPNKTELKLIGVARASLEELLLDCHDFCGRELGAVDKGPCDSASGEEASV